MAQSPVFLDKAQYRQRRLRDGLRVLPLAGAILWLVPLMWPRGEDGQSNASALIYMFVVWCALVAVGGVLARLLDPDEDGQPPKDT